MDSNNIKIILNLLFLILPIRSQLNQDHASNLVQQSGAESRQGPVEPCHKPADHVPTELRLPSYAQLQGRQDLQANRRDNSPLTELRRSGRPETNAEAANDFLKLNNDKVVTERPTQYQRSMGDDDDVDDVLEERMDSVPHKGNKDVICIEKSKLIGQKDPLMAFRRSMGPTGADAKNAAVNDRKMPYFPNSVTCYACSNVSNPFCNQPNSLTTIKYCTEASHCVKKLIQADGMMVLVRDCGDTCTSKYSEKPMTCDICKHDLCNGSFAIDSGSFIFHTICSMVIFFTMKYM